MNRFVVDDNMKWTPPKYRDNYEEFEDIPWYGKYKYTFYNSLLGLLGNDMLPKSQNHFMCSYFFLILGAFFNAHIFGTIAVIYKSFNVKGQKFQEHIDSSNTSMKNMKLPETLQEKVRDFMMSTQNNLDNQQELDSFLQMISPSLRVEVT